LTPNDPCSGCTAPLTSKRYILYIYWTIIGTEYFKHGTYSPFFFSLQNAVCFIILTYLVPVLFTFYIQGVLKCFRIKLLPQIASYNAHMYHVSVITYWVWTDSALECFCKRYSPNAYSSQVHKGHRMASNQAPSSCADWVLDDTLEDLHTNQWLLLKNPYQWTFIH